jgi:transposase
MPDLPTSIREQIIALYQHTSKSQREIASDLGISQNGVGLIIRHFEAKGNTTTNRKGHCGRKTKLTHREKVLLVRESKKNPMLTARQVKIASGEVGQKVSVNTVKRVLNKFGRRAYRPQRMPRLDTRKRVQRAQWAKLHRELNMDFWANVRKYKKSFA